MLPPSKLRCSVYHSSNRVMPCQEDLYRCRRPVGGQSADYPGAIAKNQDSVHNGQQLAQVLAHRDDGEGSLSCYMRPVLLLILEWSEVYLWRQSPRQRDHRG